MSLQLGLKKYLRDELFNVSLHPGWKSLCYILPSSCPQHFLAQGLVHSGGDHQYLLEKGREE